MIFRKMVKSTYPSGHRQPCYGRIWPHTPRMLPVKDHCNLLTKQFPALHQRIHPGNKHLDKEPSSRNLKPTCYRHKEEVQENFRGGLYKEVLSKLHTEAVSRTLQNYPPNKILGTAPPKINKEEITLNRRARSRLTRLRSGYCRSLNSYMARRDNSIQNACPDCQHTPHDTNHLFNCTMNPTDLVPKDLWTKPTKVAHFLRLEEEDDEEWRIRMWKRLTN